MKMHILICHLTFKVSHEIPKAHAALCSQDFVEKGVVYCVLDHPLHPKKRQTKGLNQLGPNNKEKVV